MGMSNLLRFVQADAKWRRLDLVNLKEGLASLKTCFQRSDYKSLECLSPCALLYYEDISVRRSSGVGVGYSIRLCVS